MGRRYRAVLAVISGHLDTALEVIEPDHPAHPDVSASRIATEELAALTRMILAFGRSASLTPTPIDLNDVVADVASSVRSVLPTHVELVVDLVSGGCPAFVDQERLEESIAHLVGNALQAMPQGTLRIGTERLRPDSADARGHPGASIGRHVAVVVSDTGEVTSEAAGEQASGAPLVTGLDRGVGLALAAVRGFVEQSGGHLSVTSRRGVGTTVRIVLPSAG